jgi:16S rRNA G966 N2-methylase RsmD
MRRERRRHGFSPKASAENCGACGNECLSSELKKATILNWDLKICAGCYDNTDTLGEYKAAASMIEKQSAEDKYREAANIMKKKALDLNFDKS